MAANSTNNLTRMTNPYNAADGFWVGEIPASELFGGAQPVQAAGNGAVFPVGWEFIRRKLRYALNPELAGMVLDKLYTQSELLGIYKTMFPTEYAQSKALSQVEPGKAYSPKELEFFNLVNDRLFEFNLDWMLEISEEDYGDGGRSSLIPLYWQSLSTTDRQWDDFELGWQLLLPLVEAYGFPRADFRAETELPKGRERWAYNRLLEIAPTPEQINYDLVVAACVALCNTENPDNAFGPLLAEVEEFSFFPLALDVIGHDTGNLFLDYDDYDGYDPMIDWSLDNVQKLAAEYKECMEIWGKVNRFRKWIEASPSNFAIVVVAWNMAATGEAASLESQRAFSEKMVKIMDVYNRHAKNKSDDEDSKGLPVRFKISSLETGTTTMGEEEEEI